jgi:uncharacterized membrane protein YagU involved in acid resistance
VAGAIGTVAMTAFMKPALAGYLPPTWRPAQFVPKQIIEWTEQPAGNPNALSEDQEQGAAVLAHLGYGAAMGALYGLARDRWTGVPAPLAGLLWGVGVWTFGYEGWLPMLGVRPATTQQPLRQWPVPIVNHSIYGMVTALTFDRLRDAGASTNL